ncbi:hypothetical protein [Nocardia sp. NBC_01388]|uniref:hypothetical protein n=1 Tax=Nocardia sp. NBC_01388 TaxID=2903596 RepID=UPI003249AE4C
MNHDLSWLPAELDPVVLRLVRADQLAAELGEVAGEWSKVALDLRQVERDDGGHDLVVKGIREIPPLATMLFSEAVHHMRAAIDNVLYQLVELGRAAPLSAAEAKTVDFPIRVEKTFKEWRKSVVRKGLVELDEGAKLGDRVACLQPYIDTMSQVPSISALLSIMTGMPVVNEHPLLLLQEYSNVDKHRMIRLALPRSAFQDEDEPFWTSVHSMRAVAVGDILKSAAPGEVAVVTAQTAVHVLRPDGITWVAPVPELCHIGSYIADVLIPTLVRGMVLPDSLPRFAELGDNGVTARQRLEAGHSDNAHARFKKAVDALYDNSYEPELKVAQRD